MLLTNGRIYPLDAADRVVDSLVVRDGRIFAGRRADVNLAIGEPIVDLGGRAVLPGLGRTRAPSTASTPPSRAGRSRERRRPGSRSSG